MDRPTPGIAAVPWGAAVREPGEGWDESNPVPATTLTLVEGATFVIASATGDIDPGGVEGLFVGDTRICSALQLRIDDHVVEPLTSAPRSPSSAAFVGRTIDRQLVFRDLSVGRGMRVDLRVRNLAGTHREVEVALRMDTDLAGLFEVKTRSVIVPPVPRRAEGATLRFADADGHRGLTAIGSEGAVAGEDGTIRWRVPLDAGREWSGCVEFRALRGGHDVASAVSCDAPLTAPKGIARMDETPRCHTDVPGLATAIRRAGEDLGALQIEDPDHPEDVLVAAGAPWYMTLFGRDSILTSWMALVLDPDMAFGTVRALARLQGREDVPETEEQPGRILHEIRSSSGASLALADGHIYYGSIDATPLFVMLVHELWRWGAGAARIQELMPALDAALAWQERRFDAGEGYLSYRAAVPGSLVNQSWKDSHDAIGFADGRLADPPIATAEVQAYAFAAWRAGAALARAFGDPGTAEERDRRAEDLRSRFARDFWLEDRGAVALALDGAGRQVDAVASNMGHCLWTGIVDEPAQGPRSPDGSSRPSSRAGGASARSPPRWPATARSATTTARCGRTTPRSRSRDCDAPGSSRRRTRCRGTCCWPPTRSADACPSCSPGSPPRRWSCPSATPRRARRRPGHRPRRCSCSARSSGWSPTSRPDTSRSTPACPRGPDTSASRACPSPARTSRSTCGTTGST